MHTEYTEELAWLRLHRAQMRRYVRMLADSGECSESTRTGLRRWVRTLRGNASNCITRLRRLRGDA